MSAFDSIATGLQDAIANAAGDSSRGTVHTVNTVDVRAVREKLGLSPAVFATAVGVSVATVRSWERARHSPRGPARVLLHIIAQEPEAARRALSLAAGIL